MTQQKRYKVQARRKHVREPWSAWTEVDNYKRAEEHAAHAEELGYRSKIVVNERQIEELWSILLRLGGVCGVTEQADAIFDAGFRKLAWVSVDERLPDICGMPVLMAAVNKYGQVKVVKGFTNYTAPFEFLTNEKEYEGVWKSAWKVTHWMPLPEPPQLEEEADERAD